MSVETERIAELDSLLQQTDRKLAAKFANISAELQAGVSDTWWSTTNAMTISAILLAFFLIVIFLATYLIATGTKPEIVLKLFGTLLIISVTSFLIVAGYSDEQIAPVIGLLGTIVGYLLGKDTNGPPAQTNQQIEKQKT